MRNKFLLNILIASAILLFGFTAEAETVKVTSKEKKAEVHAIMKTFVDQNLADNGILSVMHKGKILQLTVRNSDKYPDGFHSGVKQNGNLYTSCADFTSGKTMYDIDFLIRKTNNKYIVVQPIVHKVNGIKNPYDLSH